MLEQRQYPVMKIHLPHMYENAKRIVELCAAHGIGVSGVVKGTDSYENSYNAVAETLLSAGCVSIADSRMNTIKRMRENGFEKELLLIRIPMLSELDDLVHYADCSLQSEREVLIATNEAAGRANRIHGVILMMDLGDLREGFFDEAELIESALTVERELSNLRLRGIGTNLGCYGAVCPDRTNLQNLVDIAKKIENRIDRPLEFISGGASSSLPLLLDGGMPKAVNHLRIGESIINARDLKDFWGYELPFMHSDIYTILAEIIEIREKPSYPVGKIFIDAFGNTPTYEDRGVRKRALLALGRRDFGNVRALIPRLKGAEILGASSDHLILDVEEVKEELKVGDILEFDLYYEAMMYANNSSSVKKVYLS